ncbi:early nodulin-93-like [Zingiber officinale]|uniref:early nodulin-93-like n=1 Tax=Zingiber officinale TaxID=94328 RepID=UPI001C4C6197|nr:early nodulin-93-like [Zingiber officinale]
MKPVIASPQEEKISTSESTIQKAVSSGFKTALLTGAIAAVPTLVGCRVFPWAKHNLNHTAQALIISAASIAGFFVTADKIVLANARGNTIGKYGKSE